MAELSPENPTEFFNTLASLGWTAALGLRLVHVRLDEVVAELTVSSAHLQPYGIVHGGVYATMVESLTSIGAALNVVSEGKTVVGLENHTSFLRAVRGGTLRCTAHAINRGRSTHLWEVTVHDEADRLVATGRVRLLVIEGGADTLAAPRDVKPLE